MRLLVVLAVLGLWTRGCLGKCTDPQTSVSTYTSTDGILTPVTVYSIELEVTCKTGQTSLYALVDNQLILATQSPGGNVYQVSWAKPHDEAPKGTTKISFYDDEGASALRKSMRYEEEADITPFLTVDVLHKGVKMTSVIAPGFVAVVISLLVWWLANMTKQKLQE